MLSDKYNNGWPELHKAVREGDVNKVRKLLEKGTDVNAIENYSAGLLNRDSLFSVFLLPQSEPHGKQKQHGVTLLHSVFAARSNQTNRNQLIRLLLYNDVDPRSKDRDGNTSLHLATYYYDPFAINILQLLEGGAYVDDVNNNATIIFGISSDYCCGAVLSIM